MSQVVAKCPKMPTSDASLSERTCFYSFLFCRRKQRVVAIKFVMGWSGQSAHSPSNYRWKFNHSTIYLWVIVASCFSAGLNNFWLVIKKSYIRKFLYFLSYLLILSFSSLIRFRPDEGKRKFPFWRRASAQRESGKMICNRRTHQTHYHDIGQWGKV